MSWNVIDEFVPMQFMSSSYIEFLYLKKSNNSANSFLESFILLLKQVQCIIYAERFKILLWDLRDSQEKKIYD